MKHRIENPHLPSVHTHEKTDAPISYIVIFIVGLCVCGIVLHFVIAGLWGYFSVTQANPTNAPYAYQQSRELPPWPRLQVTPYLDMDKYRQDAMRRLNTYGWVNKQAGTVHVPIDQAMDRIAQQGLPVRSAQTQPNGSVTPGQPGANQNGAASPQGAGTNAPLPGATPPQGQPQKDLPATKANESTAH